MRAPARRSRRFDERPTGRALTTQSLSFSVFSRGGSVGAKSPLPEQAGQDRSPSLFDVDLHAVLVVDLALLFLIFPSA